MLHVWTSAAMLTAGLELALLHLRAVEKKKRRNAAFRPRRRSKDCREM